MQACSISENVILTNRNERRTFKSTHCRERERGRERRKARGGFVPCSAVLLATLIGNLLCVLLLAIKRIERVKRGLC